MSRSALALLGSYSGLAEAAGERWAAMDSDGGGADVAQTTDFQVVLRGIRPLMKGTKRLGLFVAGIIDKGLVPAEGPDGEKTALELRAEATWKGFANGSSPLSAGLASELAGRWDEAVFADNLMADYEEPALNDLAERLHAIAPTVNKGNVGEELGKLFYAIFRAAADGDTVGSLPEISISAQSAQPAFPYIDEETNKIRLVDHSISLPPKKDVPGDIQPEELAYVDALVRAYCEARIKDGHTAAVDDIPVRWSSHFQDQRKAFYSAEWLKETSWNCIDDGVLVFDEFLDTMQTAVIDTNLRSYPTGTERLLATLEQSVKVDLGSTRLSQIIDLIDGWSRKGSCHELAALQRLGWAD